jgi:hypothetical protein
MFETCLLLKNGVVVEVVTSDPSVKKVGTVDFVNYHDNPSLYAQEWVQDFKLESEGFGGWDSYAFETAYKVVTGKPKRILFTGTHEDCKKWVLENKNKFEYLFTYTM